MSRATVIKLKYPNPNRKPIIDTLTMRPPRAKDQLAVNRQGDGEAEREIALLASLCSVTTDVIEELELFDYQQLQGAFLDYLEGKHSPEPASSGKS